MQSVVHRFRDKASFICRKSLFITHCIRRPSLGLPSEYRHTAWYEKTRMVWLPLGEKSLILRLAVSTEYWRVTNRRMDILRQHSPRYA